MKRRNFLVSLMAASLLALVASTTPGQTNEFTYQGTLNDGANPANGVYDMRFQLFALVSGSPTAVGTPVERLGITVTNGVFTVNLDFSHVTGSFTGFDRFVGISVKPAGGATYTTLTPIQQITSAPYAIRSLTAGSASTATNATQLGGVAASQYVVTNDPRMSDARTPAPGSTNYIQNSTVAQASSDFNISGDGTAGGTLRGNIVSATTGFNIGSTRVLSVAGTNNTLVGENAGGGVVSSGTNNTMVGFAAGDVLSSGSFNSFLGSSAGAANTTGIANSFFGALAGSSNTTGVQNSFFGRSAGAANTTAGGNSYFGAYSGNVSTGADNSFFGSLTGLANTTGFNNAFFGAEAGKANLEGHSNSFFGARAGVATTSGDLNSFFGVNSGQSNTTGLGNSFFGANTGTATTTGNNNSFFGRSAGASNTTGTGNAFFGALAGQLNSTGIDNAFFGASAGDSNLGGQKNSFFGKSAGAANTTGGYNAFFGAGAGPLNVDGGRNSFFGAEAGLSTSTASWNSFHGSQAGYLNTSGSFNAFFGGQAGYSTNLGNMNTFIGSLAGRSNTGGSENVFIGRTSGYDNTTGNRNTTLGAYANVGSGNLTHATAIGAEAVVNTSNTVVLGRGQDEVYIPGTADISGDTDVWGVLWARYRIKVNNLGAAGGGELCRNSSNEIASCSSSLRYKTEITPFGRGLELLKRLTPIEYTWKTDGSRDVGFAAEEVAAAEPLLAIYKDGQVEGVKYRQLTTVLVNATLEQQSEIDALKSQIDQQKAIIESLRQLVCAQNPSSTVCSQPK